MQNGGTQETLTLKVKLGENEFEASGSSATVALHFATWQRLVAPAAAESTAGAAEAQTANPDTLANVFAVDKTNNWVTLRLYPAGKTAHTDATLLLLYGFHEVLGEAGRAISATRLKAALAASGHKNVRLDKTLGRPVALGWVKRGGYRKGSTYQLTVSGYQRAQQLARALRATLPSASST